MTGAPEHHGATGVNCRICYDREVSRYAWRRRSSRIGKTGPVRVKFLAYRDTMQETCIRLMGKKLLVALMMEGKFSGEGLHRSMSRRTCSPPWRGNWWNGTVLEKLPMPSGATWRENERGISRKAACPERKSRQLRCGWSIPSPRQTRFGQPQLLWASRCRCLRKLKKLRSAIANALRSFRQLCMNQVWFNLFRCSLDRSTPATAIHGIFKDYCRE